MVLWRLSPVPPADGTVYRWGPTETTLDVLEETHTAMQAWPNPTAGDVQVDFDGEHGWTLTDATGREVHAGVNQDGQRLDLSGPRRGCLPVPVGQRGKWSASSATDTI